MNRLFLLLPLLAPSLAWAYSPAPAKQSFRAPTDTDLVEAPGSSEVVAHLKRGESAEIDKHGGFDDRWCKLHVSGVDGWVKCADSEPMFPSPPVARPTVALAPGATPFVAAEATDAVDQPGSHKVVGTLKPGQTYSLLKTGGPGGVWCKLQLAEGTGWVRCTAATAATAAPPAHDDAPSGSGAFAYYVLSLSWSPAFCDSKGDKAPTEQCGVGKHYGFVVHGLWPQNEQGYPEDCGLAKVTDEQVTSMLDLMPSKTLVNHEWTKHGTCSGLSADDYFARIRAARASIHIPAKLEKPSAPVEATLAEIQQMFIEANPGLTREQMSVQCKKEVSEIRFCLDKQLKRRDCGSDVRDACKGKPVFPPLR